MELSEFVTKLAATHTLGDGEKYWRTIVHCFLIDKLEQIQLGALPNYFTQRYRRSPNYDGKLSALVQEPEFKAICNTKKESTGIWLRPSEFLKLILHGRLVGTKISARNNNNENNIVDSNPFAILAQKEKEGSADQNYEARVGRLTLEELNCGICFDLLKDAVEGDCCKNIFCLPCIEQNNRKCPNCRILVEWSANEPIRRLVGKRPVQCEFDNCKAWSTVSEIEQHRFGCEFNPVNLHVNCQKCQQRIMRRLLEEHLSDTCKMVEVPCRLCGFMFIRKDLNNHETRLCEMLEVPCPSCHSMIVRKDLTDHEERHCVFRRVLCSHGCGEHKPYNEYITSHFNRCSHQPIKCTNSNCRVLVQRRLLDKHLAECKHSKLACIHKDRGCEANYIMAEKAAWSKHITICRFMPVKCRHGCGTEMLKHQVKGHHCNYMPAECVYCHFVFREKDLPSHVREQCPSYMVECHRCKERVAKISLDEHMFKQCPDREDICSKCQCIMPHKSLAIHERYECSKRLISCEHCMEILKAEELDLHSTLSCPKRKTTCEMCNSNTTIDSLVTHCSSRCPKRRVQCADCDIYVRAFKLDRHQLHKCPKRRVQCPDCEIYVRMFKLVRHQLHECPKRLIECKLCYEDVVVVDLNEHVENQCPERFRNVQCPACDEWMFVCLLLSHRLQSCRFRKAVCPQCYRIGNHDALERHMSCWCPKRPISCCCGVNFPFKQFLKHWDDCGGRMVYCEYCNDPSIVFFLEEHKRTCPKRIVSCKKCTKSMTLKELQSHYCIGGCIIS